MATKITSGSIFSAGAVIVGVDADAPPAVPSPSPEPAPAPATAQILPLSRAVSLLMDASATADGSVVDSSTNSHSITVNGDVSQSSFSPYRSGGYSLYNTGTNHIEKTGLTAPGTGDFTIEAWVYVTDSSANQLIWDTRPIAVDNTTGINVQFRSNNKLYAGSHNVGYITGPTTFSDNEWVHVALVRSGGTLTLYGNGVSQGSVSHSVNLTSTDINIGSNRAGYSVFNGHISDLRVVNAAVYTDSFTPPTSRLTSIDDTVLLTCNLPYVQSDLTVTGDVSMAAKAPYDYAGYSESLHGGSYVFDGNGDFISAPLSDSLQLGSEDYTVESWFYMDGDIDFAGNAIVSKGTSGQHTIPFYTLEFDTSNVLKWFVQEHSSATPVVSSSPLTPYQWYHVAVTRSGSTHVMYINGVAVSTNTVFYTMGSGGDTFRVGCGWYATNREFKGSISDLRIVKGSSVYTTDFTPPTAPLTAVAGTSLLLSGNNASIRDESQSVESISVFGNTTVADSSPYGTGKSMTFDGNGDYLYSHDSSNAIGTQDFTLECWIYAKGNPSDQGIFESRSPGGPTDGFTLTAFSSSVIRIWCGGALVSSSGTNYVNEWTHLAVTRSSGTMTLYINGISQGSASTSFNLTNDEIIIGAGRYFDSNAAPSSFFNGNIADLRIVKGTAVYTTDFTPPTAPLTAVTGTSLLLAGTNASYRDQTQGVKSMSMEGNVAVESSSPFAGQRSLTFDGSGDRVVMESDALAFGTGDYTVEGWAYLDSVGYYKIIITTRPDNGGYADAFSVQVDNNTGQLFLYSNAFDMKSPSSVPVGQWFHYAVTRENSLTRMFLDGVEVNSGTLTKNYARTLVGVGDFPVTMSEPWVGEIGEIRVTKGLARYTSDFTPPTGPLGEYTEAPNVAPTISGIDASYTLVSGMDTVITGVATDLHNDPVTWSYAVTSGSLGDTTVTQADNVFTITPGTADATFQLTFTATDDNGNASTVASDFTHVYVEPTYTQGGLVLHLDAANPASYSGSGNWIDLTGNGGDATLNNGMAFDAADEGSFTIDGVDDFAQFSTSALVSGNGAFTNEFWFKWDGTAGNQPIFGYGNDVGPNVVNVAVITNNKFRFEFGSGAGITDSTTTINTGTWYHAVATYDQSSIKVYINGVLEATTAYSSANVPLSGYNGENGSIGALFSTWGNVSAGGAKRYGTFGGNVAVVRQYNRALNGTEIQFNYDASKDRYDQVVLNLDASDPASYSGSGTTWTDLAGSNDATLVNGVTYDNGSMVFDGVDDYVTVPSTLTIGDTFTYSAWIKADSLTGRSAIFSTRNPNSGDGLWQLEVGEANGPNRVGISIPGVWAYTSSDNVISTNTWHYITVVKADASTNFQVFVDGVSQGFASQSVSTSGNNNTRVIGAGVNAIYDFFDGRMGSIVMHDKALTEAEIQFNYNASRNTYNDAPTISGIDASYTLATGSDTVITGVATDPEGDAVTWTYAVSSGSLEDTTVTQADNVFTVTPGSLDATFQLTFTATDAAGKVSTHVSDFTYVYAEPVAEAQHIVVSDFRYNSNNGRISIYDANNLSASPTIVEGTASGRFGKTSSYGATLFVGAPFEATQTGALYVYDDINDTSSYSTKLTAYDGGSGDYFGQSSSANGTYLAVGAEYASTNGAVYVFDRNDYSAQPTKIVSPSSSNTARFGFNVKMNQTHLFVSAPGYNTEGAVFAYDLSDLTAPPIVFNSQEGEYGAQFGAAIDVSDTHLLITCPDDDTIASNAGAGFVYDLSDMSAAPTKLTPADSGANDRIGYESGAISNTHVAFGGIYHDPSGILNAGGVWVYDLTNLSAAPTKVTGPNPTSQDQFGRSVNIGGNTMLVGEHATWSAYVFDLTDLSAAPTTLSSGLTSGGFGEGPNAIVTY